MNHVRGECIERYAGYVVPGWWLTRKLVKMGIEEKRHEPQSSGIFSVHSLPDLTGIDKKSKLTSASI